MRTLFILITTLSYLLGYSQIQTPQASPTGSVNQRVGLTDIAIEYSRPSVKDRKIFGELVPYNVMWRTGANASTKITFSTDVEIQGNTVPAGTYALYTIPTAKDWTIVLHKNLTYWGTGDEDYKMEEDQLRFTVPSNTAYPVKIETLTIQVSDIKEGSCNIELLWENTRVAFGVTVDYDAIVMKQIVSAMQVSPRTYYLAARYYLENDKDLDQALEWINLAIEGDETYWVVRQKALILAKQGKYTEAIEAAKRSTELARAENNEHYIKLNTDSIAEWEKKK